MTKTSGDGLTVAVTGPLAENANNQSFSSTGLGRAAGPDRAAARLRLGLRRHPADPLGPVRAGNRRRRHRRAQPRHRHALDLARAHAPHRARRRRRLRPLHRDPAPAGPRGRARRRSPPSSTRSTPRAGPSSSPGSSCASRCSACSPSASASSTGWPWPPPSAWRSPWWRPSPCCPPCSGFIGPKVMSRKQKRNLAENGPRDRRCGQQGLLAQLGRPGAAVPVALGRRGPDHHRGHRPALLLAPAGLGRPGHRPGRDADPGRLRHALQGVRAGLQRAAACWWPWCSRTSTPSIDNVVARRHASSPTWPASPSRVYIPSKTGDGDVVLVNVYPDSAPQDAADHRPGQPPADRHHPRRPSATRA